MPNSLNIFMFYVFKNCFAGYIFLKQGPNIHICFLETFLLFLKTEIVFSDKAKQPLSCVHLFGVE